MSYKELMKLKAYARAQGISMSELGQRGGYKSARIREEKAMVAIATLAPRRAVAAPQQALLGI